MIRHIITILLVVVVVACAPVGVPSLSQKENKLKLSLTSFPLLPGWQKDKHFAALSSFIRSCKKLILLQNQFQIIGDIKVYSKVWKEICAAAKQVQLNDDFAARIFFENWFTPYLALNNDKSNGLFTGYYEAELHGSLLKHGRYQIPIYRPPADVISVDLGQFRKNLRGRSIYGRLVGFKLQPLETRSEIISGALSGQGLELVWVDDPIDAFFLHIQGSGRVILDDGNILRLGFAGRNGHAYVPIGKELLAKGVISKEKISMHTIQAWMRSHPKEGAVLMASNPSYIFFQVTHGNEPTGGQGVPLTPGRSLAIDKQYISYGFPIWLDTTNPLKKNVSLRHLVIAQDTGGAIKGPVRGDLFWGYGVKAAEMAGAMKQSGRYFLLIPKRLVIK